MTPANPIITAAQRQGPACSRKRIAASTTAKIGCMKPNAVTVTSGSSASAVKLVNIAATPTAPRTIWTIGRLVWIAARGPTVKQVQTKSGSSAKKPR